MRGGFYDAMVSERPYSRKMTPNRHLKIRKNAGTQFEPKIVKYL